jgi:uncharacterized RDD family membrane protein YckC
MMPIPSMLPEASTAPLLVIKPPLALLAASPQSRAFAHAIDLGCVVGLSYYTSTLLTVILLAPRNSEFAAFGKKAPEVFQEVYDLSSSLLFAASLAILAVTVLVAIPLINGKTPGMGLLGLRVRANNGLALAPSTMFLRLAGCIFTLAAAGIPLLIGLARRDGAFFQDRLSASSVVFDE